MPKSHALNYPAHFPPSDGWGRFFLGVRWLGPDLSFFSQIASLQRARTLKSMDEWGGGERQSTAMLLGSILARRLRWPTPYFLPDDSVAVVVGGPKFGGVDSVDLSDSIGEIEEQLGIKPGPAFWEASGSSTLGGLVDGLLRIKTAA